MPAAVGEGRQTEVGVNNYFLYCEFAMNYWGFSDLLRTSTFSTWRTVFQSAVFS